MEPEVSLIFTRVAHPCMMCVTTRADVPSRPKGVRLGAETRYQFLSRRPGSTWVWASLIGPHANDDADVTL